MLTASPELVALKQRKVALLKERSRLTQGFGLLNYRPHAKQDLFHAAGDHFSRLGMAGNRSGKSQGGCAEDCSWLMGYRPFYKQKFWVLGRDGAKVRYHDGHENHPLVRKGIPQRPVKGLVITIDWEKVDEVWTGQRNSAQPGKIWQLLPENFVKSTRRSSNGAICEITCRNGSTLRFDTVKSWKNDAMAVESSDYDFVHVDEPCPENMFKGAARGLVDRGGKDWFTLTPLSEMWILDKFLPREFTAKNLPTTHADGGSWFTRWSMLDNPFISEEGRKRYEATLNPDEKECRINGIPLELSGLVYKQFDWDKHVLKKLPEGWSSFSSPPKDWPIYVAFDVHPKTAQAALLMTVSPLGQKFVFDEYFRVSRIGALCEWFKSRTAGRNVVLRICDPFAWINNPVTGDNMEAEFARHEVYVEKGTKALSQGILRVQEELEQADNLYISPACSEFLWEIQRYCWDDGTDSPVDENDHMMENLYRLVLEDPKWVPFSSTSSSPVEDQTFERVDLGVDDLVAFEL